VKFIEAAPALREVYHGRFVRVSGVGNRTSRLARNWPPDRER
jgi:hypothetical protein